MSKYDKMIALNKKASDEKVAMARNAIHKMMDEGQKVTVPKLMQKTGLSRGFFYKNEIIRREVDKALQQQAGMVDPKRYIGDMALRSRIELFQQQNRELQKEVETLRKDKERLEKALNRRDMELMKNF
ncbi:MAG: DUF6262 family protein [Lachnospiraceae bacterium]